jgi:SAM-dependent methyltransferase
MAWGAARRIRALGRDRDALVNGDVLRKRKKALAAGSAIGVCARLWWLRHREDRPYGPAWIDQLPRPGISRTRLVEILAPRPGERLLEVGPGFGYYSLAVARALEPGGILELLDIRQPLLDYTLTCALEQGSENVRTTLGDGELLPYPDGGFEAAYLVACLSETPDAGAALAELARVLRPGGRLVVGETVADRHRIRPTALTAIATGAGLRPVRRIGRNSYFARFEKSQNLGHRAQGLRAQVPATASPFRRAGPCRNRNITITDSGDRRVALPRRSAGRSLKASGFLIAA